jgi:hypothetical protein
MKKVFTVFICCSVYFTGSAQVVETEKVLRRQNSDTLLGWHSGAEIGINISQASFSNWASGGVNSIAGAGLLNLVFGYKTKNTGWDNTLDLGYGLLRQGKVKTWIKTDDRIDFTSKIGRKAGKGWYYSGFGGLRTQFAPGYDLPDDSNLISDFFAPAYIMAAIGMDYKKDKIFSAFLAPFTSKTTLVLNQDLADAGAFGVEKAQLNDSGEVIVPGKNVRTEFGGYVRLSFRKTFSKEKNMTLTVRTDLFSNYLHNPGNIDVNLEAAFTMKVNKFLSASISTQMIYDDDVMIKVDRNNDGITDGEGPRLQFKEVIAIVLTFKL